MPAHGAWAGIAIDGSERPLWVGLTHSTHDRRTAGIGRKTARGIDPLALTSNPPPCDVGAMILRPNGSGLITDRGYSLLQKKTYRRLALTGGFLPILGRRNSGPGSPKQLSQQVVGTATLLLAQTCVERFDNRLPLPERFKIRGQIPLLHR